MSIAGSHTVAAVMATLLALVVTSIHPEHRQAILYPTLGVLAISILNHRRQTDAEPLIHITFALALFLALQPILAQGSLPTVPDLPPDTHPLLQFIRALIQLLVPISHVTATTWLIGCWTAVTITRRIRGNKISRNEPTPQGG